MEFDLFKINLKEMKFEDEDNFVEFNNSIKEMLHFKEKPKQHEEVELTRCVVCDWYDDIDFDLELKIGKVVNDPTLRESGKTDDVVKILTYLRALFRKILLAQEYDNK